MGHFAFVVGVVEFTGNQFLGIDEVPNLDKLHHKSDENTRTDQQADGHGAPDETVKRIQKICHGCSP